MKKVVGTILGTIWFIIWLVGGTWLILLWQESSTYWAGLFLPFYFIVWVASLFIGQAIISFLAKSWLKRRNCFWDVNENEN
jgi:hypothetical protein